MVTHSNNDAARVRDAAWKIVEALQPGETALRDMPLSPAQRREILTAFARLVTHPASPTVLLRGGGGARLAKNLAKLEIVTRRDAGRSFGTEIRLTDKGTKLGALLTLNETRR